MILFTSVETAVESGFFGRRVEFVDVGFERVAQAKRAARHADELHLGAGEFGGRGHDMQARDLGRHDRFVKFGVADQDFVDRDAALMLGDAKARRGVALGVGIDHQNRLCRRPPAPCPRLIAVVVLPTPPF